MAAGGSPVPAAATGAVRFVPLLGVDSQQPLSYLLELDGFVILLDCGWNDSYDPDLLQPVVAVLPRVDAVLLSHSDPAHLGALPYLAGRLGLRAPVYATSPVHKMGQMFMYDQYLSRQAVSDFDVFNLDDVDAAFALVQPLRYQQNLSLRGKGAGIVITPFAAGHMLGGAVWRVSKGGEDYVYAVDYNHRKERHLSGAALESAFRRPALLITDALNALQLAPEKPGRERRLLDAVMATLRGDGSVLMPVDTAGRLLELVLLVERHWAEHRLTYPLVLLSAMAYSTLEFAKSQLEWMNEGLVRSLGHSRDNPFSTRFLKLCSSREELAHLPRGPKLVLATLPSLEAGFSRQLFLEWAAEPRNAVIFPTPAAQGTLAQRVLQLGAQRDAAGPAAPPPMLRLVHARRVPLEGLELEEHLAQQARRAEEEAAAKLAAAAAAAAEAVAAEAAEAAQRDGAAAAAELLSPRASVQRVSSLSIGHLRSQRGSTGTAVLGEVVAPDGRPVAEAQAPAAAAAAACLVEGFELPRGATAPMFPAEDEWEAVAYDEYGVAVDHADFEAAATPAFKAMASELEAEAEAEDAAAPPDIPTKVEAREVDVTLRCAVLCFDFEGRSDGRSVRTMLAHVAPRQLILVRGTAEGTAALAEHLRGELASLLTKVHTPAAGQAVELAAEPSYRLALSDELMAGLRQHRIGDCHLAWVEGVVGPPADGSESQLPQLLPAAHAGADGGYGGVFIGDARLSELKQALAAVGIASEFHAGALYCAGHVVVRRRAAGGGADGGGLELEGALSEEYYRIREVVYGQYHIC